MYAYGRKAWSFLGTMKELKRRGGRSILFEIEKMWSGVKGFVSSNLTSQSHSTPLGFVGEEKRGSCIIELAGLNCIKLVIR